MVEVRSPIAAAFEAPGPPEELGALGDGYFDFEASHIVISREQRSGRREFMVCWRCLNQSSSSGNADLSEPLLRFFDNDFDILTLQGISELSRCSAI